jgi:peptide/nickel transport system substrate-binding protein
MARDDSPAPRDGLNRRRFLERSLAAGAVVSLPAIAAACGDSDDDGTTASAPATTQAAPATSEAAAPTSEATTTTAAETTAAEPTAAEPTAAATSGADPNAKRGGVLRMAVSGGGVTESLDPHAIVNAPDQARALNIFDRLAQTTADLQVENTLAESIEANADATVWQVKLKAGIEFSDGKPLTADDVLYSYKRIGLDDKQPYFSNLDMFDLEAAKKVDELTIEFPLTRPYGDMPRLMASRFLSIVQDGTADFKDPAKVIGTGPFTVGAFTPAERTTLMRNDRYWRDGFPYADQVDLISIDPEAQPNALLSGQVDAIEKFEPAQAKQQQEQGRVQVIVVPGANVPNFTMRLDTPPFDDPKVREAFRLSIDRQKMVDTIFLGNGVVGNDLHGLAYPSYNKDLPQRPYDPERAKALLAEAGHSDGLTVELITGLFVPDATAFAEQAKASGIDIKLKRVTPDEVYNTDLYYLKAPFGETSWGADSFEFIAPQGLFENAPYNETGWKRPEWDARFKEAAGTQDDAARNAIYYELQEELYNEGGYIIWGYGDTFYGAANNVQGLISRPGFVYGEFHFELLWLA